MNNIDNKVLRRINSLFDFILLNILWILACVPIFTVFPATAAMFGVVRRKVLEKEINGICRLFLAYLKKTLEEALYCLLYGLA
ncbi:YesL family protein [Priestia megaterium]